MTPRESPEPLAHGTLTQLVAQLNHERGISTIAGRERLAERARGIPVAARAVLEPQRLGQDPVAV
jgi:hypothetical protein